MMHRKTRTMVPTTMVEGGAQTVDQDPQPWIVPGTPRPILDCVQNFPRGFSSISTEKITMQKFHGGDPKKTPAAGHRSDRAAGSLTRSKNNLAKGYIAVLSPLAGANGFIQSWWPSNIWFPGPKKTSSVNGISIGSAVFTQHMPVANTDRQTYGPRYVRHT